MFRLNGTLKTTGAPVLKREIIANNAEIDVMDSAAVISGFVAPATSATNIFGHVYNVGTFHGVGLADFTPGVDTFTAAANNQTVAKVKAEVDISKFTLYSGLLDETPAGASQQLMAAIDLEDEKELNTTSAHATNSLQYRIWGADEESPADRSIVSIFESQVFGPLSA